MSPAAARPRDPERGWPAGSADPAAPLDAPALPPARVRRPPMPARRGWIEHRSEVAAIVTGFVALVWGSVGLALGAWVPAAVGAAFGMAALAIWVLEVQGP